MLAWQARLAGCATSRASQPPNPPPQSNMLLAPLHLLQLDCRLLAGAAGSPAAAAGQPTLCPVALLGDPPAPGAAAATAAPSTRGLGTGAWAGRDYCPVALTATRAAARQCAGATGAQRGCFLPLSCSVAVAAAAIGAADSCPPGVQQKGLERPQASRAIASRCLGWVLIRSFWEG